MYKLALSIGMLCISNLFMTFAWYGFLKKPGRCRPCLVEAGAAELGTGLFEYCFMVPANHIGRSVGLSLAQLKIMQEAITLCIFVPFMLFYMGEQWKWDYLWALLCVMGAVYFVNREALLVS